VKINRSAAVAAPVGGLLLGALDVVWITYVPWPLGALGNSVAVWAVPSQYLTAMPVALALPAAVLFAEALAGFAVMAFVF
jgi:hypothetical protein